MSFSEKLTELRKKAGMSQEELGYKLNVTRQTVSKWELGQTTPEMDKLVELSKIFNVTIDELTGDVQINNNTTPISENKPIDDTKKKRIIIICVAAAVVVLLFLGALYLQKLKDTENVLGIFNKQNELSDGIIGTAQGMLDSIQDQMNEQLNDSNNISSDIKNEILGVYSEVQQEIEEGKNKIEEEISSFETKKFNAAFELYQGTQYGNSLRMLLDKIITNNKTQDKKVTLKVANKELTDANKIKDLKTKIDNFKKYEVSFEYDKAGYIYEVTIK